MPGARASSRAEMRIRALLSREADCASRIGEIMFDLLVLAVGVAGFAAMVGYAVACERL